MPDKHPQEEKHNIFVKLSRLETLGDAIFAFALTLLAFDLRLPETNPTDLGHGLQILLPKLVVVIFAFLVIAQHWDVHQRTMLYIDHADGVFIWLNLLSLLFIVLLPASADILGRYPMEPLSLIIFGINLALFSLTSWFLWRYASGKGHLLVDNINPQAVKVIAALWLYPPVIITLSLPISLLNVYPVYAIWALMPVLSYSFSVRTFSRISKKAK
jgi:uncharacterized membrane protein